MRALLLLADAAQAVEGKLYILGGGWSVTGPEPSPMAVAVKIEVPWDLANQVHDVELTLLDEDGQPAPEGAPLRIDGRVEVGRPPGLARGTALDVPLAVSVGPIAGLRPGGRYEWVLRINSETNDAWRAGFQVRSLPGAG